MASRLRPRQFASSHFWHSHPVYNRGWLRETFWRPGGGGGGRGCPQRGAPLKAAFSNTESSTRPFLSVTNRLAGRRNPGTVTGDPSEARVPPPKTTYAA